METFQRYYVLHISSLEKTKIRKWSQIGKRWAPGNDEDPSNKFVEILNMGSIPIKIYEMEIW